MNDGKVIFEVELDTKSFIPQMEATKDELEDLMKKYDDISKDEPFDGQEKQLQQLDIQIQKTANRYVDLRKKQQAVEMVDFKKSLSSVKNVNMMDNVVYNKSYALQYNQLGTSMAKVSGQLPYIADGFKDIGKEAEFAGKKEQDAGKKGEKAGKDMSKGFSKGLKSLKKLALGIIGIRGAYMLARRAANAYMSQDEELGKKMQSFWTGLGAFLEPLLNALTNAMLKFLGYVNEFVKALTGIDYIARANARELEKQAKAQAKLNKEMQQYDFDVIRTQQSKELKDEDKANIIEIPELNQGLVKKLQDLAEWLKKNKDLIKDVGIALGVTFGAIAIGDILANIAKLIGSGSLMTGLAGLATLLAATYVLKVYVEGKKDIDDMWNKVNDMSEKGLIKQQEVHEQKIESPDSDEAKNYASKIQGLPGLIDKINKIQQFSDSLQRSKSQHPILNALGWFKGDEQALENLKRNLKQHINQLLDLADANLINEDGLEELAYTLNNYDNISKYVTIDETRLRRAYEKSNVEIMRQKGELKGVTTEYEELLIAFKREHPEIDLNTKEAREEFENFVNETLGSLPEKMTTKIEVDDKDAIDKTNKIKTGLLNLPKTIMTIIKTKLDTEDAEWQYSQLRKKITGLPVVGDLFAKLLKINGFAAGGYISQPTLAMVGEGKYNEYVIPEGEDYISKLASEIGKYGNGGSTVNVYLDGRLIQRQVDNTRDRIKFTKNR